MTQTPAQKKVEKGTLILSFVGWITANKINFYTKPPTSHLSSFAISLIIKINKFF